MASFFVIQGRDQGARFELSASTGGLGRDASNSIQMHDTEVSRHHAEFCREKSQYTLTDLGSANGTFVNDRRLDSDCVLTNGDRIRVGRTLMLFTDPGETVSADLTNRIDIVTSTRRGDESRIIRSMSQSEGSGILEDQGDSAGSPWLARARSNLQVMYRTALAVSHTLDIDQLLDRIMGLIFEWVEADRGCVMLIDRDSGQLKPRVRRDRTGTAADEVLTISKTILDFVTEHQEGVLTSDAREDERWTPAASIVQMGIREAICVPMQGRYDMVGLIYIDTSVTPEQAIVQRNSNKFNEEHLQLMIAIAHQAALAVEDTRYYSAMVEAEQLAAVGQAIAVLSHHIKNILQGIRGGSYLIEMGLESHDEETVGKGWHMVERNQNKISSLVMDMLTYSKQREPELVPADLNQVVSEVVELIQSRAQERGVAIDLLLDKQLPEVMFDTEGIHHAVLNIVTNALDACDGQQEGRVSVSTQYCEQTGTIRVTVEDNGTGITPEDLEKVFTIFSSDKGARGTGLGLPVSQKIAKEHGGQLTVTSTPEKGSRFTLEFPAITSGQPSQDTGVDHTTEAGK